MPQPFVRYEVADGIAQIVLDRPPVNALSLEMVRAVVAALRRAAADEKVRAVILASAIAGRFCAGLDLSGLVGKPAETVREFLQEQYGSRGFSARQSPDQLRAICQRSEREEMHSGNAQCRIVCLRERDLTQKLFRGLSAEHARGQAAALTQCTDRWPDAAHHGVFQKRRAARGSGNSHPVRRLDALLRQTPCQP